MIATDPGIGGGPFGTLSVTSPLEIYPYSADSTGKKAKAVIETVNVTGPKNAIICYRCVEEEK